MMVLTWHEMAVWAALGLFWAVWVGAALWADRDKRG